MNRESYAWRSVRRLMVNRLGVVALATLVLVIIVVTLGPLVVPHRPYAINPRNAFAPPSAAHWLGTDDLGRDTLSRLLHGGNVSLMVGFVAMSVSVIIGIVVGSLSGYFSGWVDSLLMRMTDAMMSLPRLFLLLLILTLFGGDLVTVILVIGITSWMSAARIVRSEFLRWKESVFVEASQALGGTSLRIMVRHILPQAMSSIIVVATFGIARAILLESSMSFLGLGVQPPTPTWGNMLTNAQTYIWSSPIQAVYPGLAILLTVLSFNFAGDALRDALDPRQRG